MSNVHKDWIINDDTSRMRSHVISYDDEKIWIDLSSLLNY